MKQPSLLVSQSGQAITEAILILTMLMFITFMVGKYFKDQELVKSLISGPWQSLAGMLQNGSWGTPEKTMIIHPNAHARHIVIQGEPAQ